MTTSTGPRGAVRSDRVGAVVLFALAVLYGLDASRISYSFSSDPLGPRVFPLILAGVLALLSLIYFFRPGSSEPWPQGRLLASSIAIPGLVLVATLLLEPLGFAIAITLLVTGVGRIFGASWRFALFAGIVQAALWFLLFRYLLEVYLPGGSIFGF
ncbi:tripartite tricarboxylate transporter TctB family protein [Microvirga arabica]|uniref:tripartite tricarboxylate transporter TctB family protein n=1 Tax=Microvirga arabica TaxID=1128671 RepID=UPI0019395CCF|nr:tripartite tricarboxylate transporter TctB family protein [Microvirga arabica]MBM1174140.1 tripartite tricarboxylate transporter TctB family protein [Microvirga arabica]